MKKLSQILLALVALSFIAAGTNAYARVNVSFGIGGYDGYYDHYHYPYSYGYYYPRSYYHGYYYNPYYYNYYDYYRPYGGVYYHTGPRGYRYYSW